MNKNNKPDWVIASMVSIVILTLIGMCIGDYLSYLSEKEKQETIRSAILNGCSLEQIQGLVNYK